VRVLSPPSAQTIERAVAINRFMVSPPFANLMAILLLRNWLHKSARVSKVGALVDVLYHFGEIDRGAGGCSAEVGDKTHHLRQR
jgi:hypothetical protein